MTAYRQLLERVMLCAGVKYGPCLCAQVAALLDQLADGVLAGNRCPERARINLRFYISGPCPRGRLFHEPFGDMLVPLAPDQRPVLTVYKGN